MENAESSCVTHAYFLGQLKVSCHSKVRHETGQVYLMRSLLNFDKFFNICSWKKMEVHIYVKYINE
jgi:hypothetical protein